MIGKIKSMLNFRKTVVINATNIGNKINGIGNYSLNLIHHLNRLKSDVRFIIYLNKSCSAHFQNVEFSENLKIKWVSKYMSPEKNFLGHLFRMIYSNYLSIKHYKFLQFNTSPLEICFYKKNQLVTVHDIIPILFKKYHKRQYLFYKVVLKYILRNVKAVIAPSVYTKKLILKHYGLSDESVKVIPLAADMQINQNANENIFPFPFILYVGRINEMKNISRILKSFIILNRFISIDLVVVGDNEKIFNNFLEISGCSEDIKNKIKFINNVSEAEKLSLMKNASTFIYPTLFEGFGFPPLEAMSCGCPVITSNNSSFSEVCGDAAYYVDPHDENDIAEGIAKVLTDSELRNKLIKNGFENIKSYSWEKTVLEHVSVIEQILCGLNLDGLYTSVKQRPLRLERDENLGLN